VQLWYKYSPPSVENKQSLTNLLFHHSWHVVDYYKNSIVCINKLYITMFHSKNWNKFVVCNRRTWNQLILTSTNEVATIDSWLNMQALIIIWKTCKSQVQLTCPIFKPLLLPYIVSVVGIAIVAWCFKSMTIFPWTFNDEDFSCTSYYKKTHIPNNSCVCEDLKHNVAMFLNMGWTFYQKKKKNFQFENWVLH
jgi:hypothetical protein